MGRAWRVHHADPPGPGHEVLLDREESHHVRRVLRLEPGDPLSVFDGRGREWSARVLEAERGGVRVLLGEELADPVEPDLPVHLYQGLCRPERMDWLVQKGTEVGLLAIHLVVTSKAKPPGITERRLARWYRIAKEACKQSGRRRIPTIESPNSFPPVPSDVLGLVLHSPAPGRPLGDYLGRSRPREVWLAVGPEEGFDPGELKTLERSGWRRAALGPRTLRAETAGVVAGTIVLHAWSDLGAGHPGPEAS